LVFSSPDGYSLTLPGGWTATALGPNDVEPLLSLLGASNPDLGNLVRNILNLTHARASMVGGNLRDTSAAVPPNVTVLIQPSGGLPLDFVGPIVQQLVKQIPGVTGNPTRDKVSLPSGDAIRMDYQVQPDGGGALIGLRTYVIVRGSQTFLFTFTASADHVADQGPTFDQIIGSLQFAG
jgi:hypothetical protein